MKKFGEQPFIISHRKFVKSLCFDGAYINRFKIFFGSLHKEMKNTFYEDNDMTRLDFIFEKMLVAFDKKYIDRELMKNICNDVIDRVYDWELLDKNN